MKHSCRWLTAVSALAASLFLWSCENVGEVTQPLSPNQATLAKGGTSGTLQLVEAIESFGSVPPVSAVIGSEGGYLGDAMYSLTVPRGAVAEPTLFVIGAAKELSGKLAIKATATSCPSANKEICLAEPQSNNVGQAGFTTPVTISLGFDPGGGAKSWFGVTMVLVGSNGLEPIPTNLMMAQKEVRGQAKHFSLYGIAWPK